jgi:hypothetical protein
MYARATYRYGLALIKQGQVTAGLAQFHQSLDALQVMQSGDAEALRLAQLAEVYGYTGRPERGLRLVAAAMAADTEECCDVSGRYRMQGELLLLLPCPDLQQAESCFQHALALARRQHAKMPELRAALRLSCLWHHQGKRVEARELLAPIYSWFTEGFTTADLQEAKALLDELA